jgi:hypothetical protein
VPTIAPRTIDAGKRTVDTPITPLVRWQSVPRNSSVSYRERPAWFSEERENMDGSRKPLAKVEGRRRMRFSGVTVAWRGTPELDDWVAYIVNGTQSRNLILADHASERKVKGLLSRLQSMSKKEIDKLAKS